MKSTTTLLSLTLTSALVRVVLPNGLAVTLDVDDKMGNGCSIEDFTDIMIDKRTRMEHFLDWQKENDGEFSAILTSVRANVAKVLKVARRHFAERSV